MTESDVSIIGGGFVGQVLKKYYTDAPIYDEKIDLDPLDDVLKKKVWIIAFNVPNSDGFEAVAHYARLANSGQIILIKSTFIPGTTDKLQSAFPDLRFVYNPEFLTELTAQDDFLFPKIQILGCTHQSLPLVHELFELLPMASEISVISALDAEVLKHAKNSYYATKVTYFNQLYDACGQLGADYETVRGLMVKDPWIGDSHSYVFHGGYRGFGGKCLPKDTKALSDLTEFPILKSIQEYNDKLRS